MGVGIESINVYGGSTYIDTREIFEAKGLDLERFDNLLLLKKAMVLPCEDPVTNAVNAAKPILDRLTEEERNSIEMVITATESGMDYAKSISTYIHEYLGLSRNCRLFEIKQACYGGTAALQMAASFVASQASPGAKVLVVATDVAFPTEQMSYAEASQAEGAVAMLVSDQPHVLELDFGANGYYGYNVMDVFRPLPGLEYGEADMSILAYTDCLENSYEAYAERVEGVDFQETFDYFSFHTPFGGLVKGAHRKLMRQKCRAKADVIEADFQRRVMPSLYHNMEIGNLFSSSVYIALASLVDHADIQDISRVGLYSYGSGSSSEFFSGTVGPHSKAVVGEMNITGQLQGRYRLTIDQYEALIPQKQEMMTGVQNKVIDHSNYLDIYDRTLRGQGLLVLTEVTNFHRKYGWT